MAKGYVIAQTNPRDQAKYDEYRKQVAATVEAHGGRFLVRGGDMEVLEGDWSRPRVVVIEFPSVEAAKGWYNSDDYRPLVKLRQAASDGTLVLVEGA